LHAVKRIVHLADVHLTGANCSKILSTGFELELCYAMLQNSYRNGPELAVLFISYCNTKLNHKPDPNCNHNTNPNPKFHDGSTVSKVC